MNSWYCIQPNSYLGSEQPISKYSLAIVVLLVEDVAPLKITDMDEVAAGGSALPACGWDDNIAQLLAIEACWHLNESLLGNLAVG